MFQRGLGGSTGVSGLSFWRGGSIIDDALTKAVSLVGSDQRASAVPADRCARELVAYDPARESCCAPISGAIAAHAANDMCSREIGSCALGGCAILQARFNQEDANGRTRFAVA
jgi:hypothetical protein